MQIQSLLTDYRDLIYFLLRTDIIKNYKQTLIGPLWAVVEPVLTMVVFTFIFGRIQEINTDDMNIAYPVFLYAGLLPWNYMRSSVARGASALVSNRNLVQSIFFPREILVLVPLFSSAFDFVIGFAVFLVLMLLFGVSFQYQTVFLPLVMAGVAALSFGLGLLLSAINARYRDVTQGIPYMLQIWMYFSPVIYPPDFLSGQLNFLLVLNPMTGYLLAARGLMLGTEWDYSQLLVSVALTLIVLAAGWWYFRNAEKSFVDLI